MTIKTRTQTPLDQEIVQLRHMIRDLGNCRFNDLNTLQEELEKVSNLASSILLKSTDAETALSAVQRQTQRKRLRVIQ